MPSADDGDPTAITHEFDPLQPCETRYRDRQRKSHLDCVIEGTTPASLYATAIDRGFVTRLDHAAYLGRELARFLASRLPLRAKSVKSEPGPPMTLGMLPPPASG